MANYEKLQNWLLTRRDELDERLANIKRDATRKNSADWSEQAQERENDEVIDALGNEATIELQKVNKALDRMNNDEYGLCQVCGSEVSEERLDIMPYADMCISCAEAKDH